MLARRFWFATSLLWVAVTGLAGVSIIASGSIGTIDAMIWPVLVIAYPLLTFGLWQMVKWIIVGPRR